MRIASFTMLLALCCAHAHAQESTKGVSTQLTEAEAVCQSGKRSRLYDEPAEACWGAFEEAVDRLEFANAAAAVRRGCEKYGRGDYCTFIAWFEEGKTRVIVMRPGRENERIGRALAYAAEFLWPPDVEDAEIGARALKRMSAGRPARQSPR